MNPRVWGPHAWIFLHSITLNYPQNPTEKEMDNYYNFFMMLRYVLPCDKCKGHYNDNLKKHPLTKQILSSRENVIKWLINIHNCVNEMTRKKHVSYDKVILKYYNLYNPTYFTYKNILIGVIVILLIYFIYISYGRKPK